MDISFHVEFSACGDGNSGQNKHMALPTYVVHIA